MITSDLDREALQLKLLGEIFSQSVKNELILKGGMAMRVAHASVRYTKDIDMDAPPDMASTERVRSIVRSSIKNALSDGLIRDIRISEPKKTDTTLRWKINGNLLSHTPIQLTVEISRRPTNQLDHVKTYQSNLTGKVILVDAYDDSAMCASKVRCLLSENRFAVRDIFDLDVLIQAKCQPSPEMFDNIENPEQSIRDMWDKIETMNFREFQTQVGPTLPKAYSSRFSESMYEDMRIRVGTEVEKWIKQSKKSIKSKSPGMGI